MNKKDFQLLELYILGYEHASEEVYEDNYYSALEDKAYQLGWSHFLQGKFEFAEEEILKQIKND